VNMHANANWKPNMSANSRRNGTEKSKASTRVSGDD
jgi:hypothetical protein